MSKFETMTKEEALQFCYDHEEEFKSDGGTQGEFECLIVLVDDGDIKPTDLPSYGMDY